MAKFLFEGYTVTSGYGIRRDPITGIRDFHEGVDLFKALGSPVSAFAGGVVSFAGDGKEKGTGFGGYGNVVAIRDRNFKIHAYCHLKSIDVNVGDKVEAGKIIGIIGNTGRVAKKNVAPNFGTHLHFMILRGDIFHHESPLEYLNREFNLALPTPKPIPKPKPCICPKLVGPIIIAAITNAALPKFEGITGSLGVSDKGQRINDGINLLKCLITQQFGYTDIIEDIVQGNNGRIRRRLKICIIIHPTFSFLSPDITTRFIDDGLTLEVLIFNRLQDCPNRCINTRLRFKVSGDIADHFEEE